MKTLVVYYSRSGNNRFLAERLAKDCNGDALELRPRIGAFALLILASLTGLSLGNRKTRKEIGEYDAVIACGPIWMGQLIAPLRDFMAKHRKEIRKLYLAICCGGGEDEKDSKFGYNQVFEKARAILGEAFAGGEAFPIELVVPDELKGNGEEIMKIRLSEGNFTGAIAEKYGAFVRKVNESQ